MPVRMMLASLRNQLAIVEAGRSGFQGGMLWPMIPQQTMKTAMKTGPIARQRRQRLNSGLSVFVILRSSRFGRSAHLENRLELLVGGYGLRTHLAPEAADEPRLRLARGEMPCDAIAVGG